MKTRREKVYKKIYECLNTIIVEDDREYLLMSRLGITNYQEAEIINCLNQTFKYLTNDDDFETEISWIIVYTTQSFIKSLINNNNKWLDLYKNSSREEICNIIYDNIIYQLGDDTHWPCFLEKVKP